MARKEIREQVVGQMVAVGLEASKNGKDPWAAIESTFPGTPADVIADAWVKVSDGETEAWWNSVEKTIDGEIIRRAIVSVAE